jgi:hypothetical protein
MNDKNREWRKSPIRIFRRGAISILGGYFFVNGLAKGGVTILVLMLFLGDNWVTRYQWLSIGIAVAVGVGILVPTDFSDEQRGRGWAPSALVF